MICIIADDNGGHNDDDDHGDDDDQIEEISGDDVAFVSLISSAATRVWDVFYQQKKDVSVPFLIVDNCNDKHFLNTYHA